MRPAKQIKVILPQLEILDDLKAQLKTVLDYTNHVIGKGKSWMEGTNNETFFEINKFLTDEICECFKQCQDITKDLNEDYYHQPSLQDQDKGHYTTTESIDTLKTSKSPEFDIKEGNNDFKKMCTTLKEMEEIISLQSKKIKRIERKFQEHTNETKEAMCIDRKESENQYKIKFDEIVEEFDKASNFMASLETQNEDVISQIKEHDKQMSSFIKTLHSVQEQIKEHEQKLLAVNKLDKNFDTTIPNLQEKLKDLAENLKSMEINCMQKEESCKLKFDDNKIKPTELLDKILNISSQVDTMSKELKLSRQQACFFAQAFGEMNVRMDLRECQIVTSFCHVLNNIGNHYDPTKGIFTAPCDGLYLCSITLRFDIGENVVFGIRIKKSNVEGYNCVLQIPTTNSSASVTTLLILKQNDQVYVASCYDYQQIKLNMYSYFMCYLVNKF